MAFGGDMEAFFRSLSALTRRKINILSLYQGSVPLDKCGNGTVKLTLPNFSGRMRLMAVAVTDKAVGSGDAGILVRNPVVIDVALPRYVSIGDEFTLPIMLHNVTHEEGEYSLTLESQKGLILETKDMPHTITLKKGGQQTIGVKAKAVEAGEAKVVVTLNGPNNLKLRSEEIVPVIHAHAPDVKTRLQCLKPGEAFTMTAEETFKGMLPGTGELKLSFYGNVPWDALSYLNSLRSYPYVCAEQITSRGFAEWATLALIKQEKPNRSPLERLLTYLSDLQRSDGSFSLWPRSPSKASPWLTASIIHLLQKSKEQGATFSQNLYKKATTALNHQLRSLSSNPTDEELLVHSYGLYLLTKEKVIQSSDIRYFYDTYYKQLPNKFAKSFMIVTLALIHDQDRLTQALKNWENQSSSVEIDSIPFASTLRDNAGTVTLLLEAMKNSPNNKPLTELLTHSLQSLVMQLHQHSRLSTQEQAWVLLATQELMQAKKKTVFTVLIDEKEEQIDVFKTLTYHEKEIIKPVVIKNMSNHPLWISLVMQGVPVKEQPEVSKGMKIKRHLHTLKGESVSEDKLVQGQSYVIVVEGTRDDDAKESRLLVADYLSAGAYIEDPDLNPSVEDAESPLPWLKEMSSPAYREMRDDRFVAALTLPPGQKNFKVAYTIKASGQGTYHAIGTRIEDMYQPEHHVLTSSRTTTIVSA